MAKLTLGIKRFGIRTVAGHQNVALRVVDVMNGYVHHLTYLHLAMYLIPDAKWNLHHLPYDLNRVILRHSKIDH